MAQGAPIVVGSKRFTESYVLGEIVRQTLAAQGIEASTSRAWATPASSRAPWRAARSTSTRSTPEPSCANCSSAKAIPDLAELNRWLAPRGFKAAVPLGFNNTYALAMLESRAEALGIRKISDLLKPEPPACASGCRTSSCSAPMAGRR